MSSETVFSVSFVLCGMAAQIKIFAFPYEEKVKISRRIGRSMRQYWISNRKIECTAGHILLRNARTLVTIPLMNALHLRAIDLIEQVETLLQPVAAAQLWKNEKYSINADARFYAFTLIGHLLYADGFLHHKEIELAEMLLPKKDGADIKKTIREYADVFEEDNDARRVPEFLRAALVYDESQQKATARSLIGLLEQIGTVAIAVDGQKANEEVRTLNHRIARLIDACEAERLVIRSTLVKSAPATSSKHTTEIVQEPTLDVLLDELRSMG